MGILCEKLLNYFRLCTASELLTDYLFKFEPAIVSYRG